MVKLEYERRRVTDLPEQEPRNPQRRAAIVGAQAEDAPGRITEKRPRSVSVSREAVKEDTDPHLRQHYTNGDGVMICQICKKALPIQVG